MHKKGCHRSTHQRKRREMKLVLPLLLPARGGMKAKCAEGSGERARGRGGAGIVGEGGGAEGRNQGWRQNSTLGEPEDKVTMQ